MKHLKRIFESVESPPTLEEIRDIFVEIIDLGFKVTTSLDWFFAKNESDLQNLFNSAFKISKTPQKGSRRCYTVTIYSTFDNNDFQIVENLFKSLPEGKSRLDDILENMQISMQMNKEGDSDSNSTRSFVRVVMRGLYGESTENDEQENVINIIKDYCDKNGLNIIRWSGGDLIEIDAELGRIKKISISKDNRSKRISKIITDLENLLKGKNVSLSRYIDMDRIILSMK